MHKEKLRILFVRPTLGYGGADRVTINILQDFDRSRYECDLILMRKKGEFVEEIPGDIKVMETGSATPLLMYPAVSKLLRSGRYDVVYSTSGGTNALVALASMRAKRKLTTIISERNILLAPGKNKFKQYFTHFLKRVTYGRADYVTVVSQELQQQMRELLKVREDKLRVVYNPIVNDTLLDEHEEVTHPVFQEGEPVILAVGRLVHQKDYPMLFEAFRIVNETKPSQLFILGKGPLEDELKQKAAYMSLSDRIHFAGFDKNPFKYMKRSSVFALSSLHEGMPGVLIQAMACGAPCVATDCPTGPSEVITDGENGYLVEVGNAALMADRILKVLNDEELAQKFRSSGAASVKSFHHHEAIESYFNFLP